MKQIAQKRIIKNYHNRLFTKYTEQKRDMTHTIIYLKTLKK